MFGMSTVISIWIFVGLMVLAVMLLMSMLARLYRKAGPHEALVVYGFRGTRVVKGHGTIIFPMIENCRGLSLELMSFDVAPPQDLYTKQGVAVTVEAVAQIKVKSDTESILTASEQFLTKTPQEREGLIRLVMEGHLRGIIGQLTVEEIVKQTRSGCWRKRFPWPSKRKRSATWRSRKPSTRNRRRNSRRRQTKPMTSRPTSCSSKLSLSR